MCSRVAHETREVTIFTSRVQLYGNLTIPENPHGTVVFAHGSGSSRFSTRNHTVAETLNQGGLATLLFDLLTPEEHRVDEHTGEFRFDMDLLTRRLTGTLDWLTESEPCGELPLGLFGASTGAAAALRTAAERPRTVGAVVSRGGRPDLAGAELARVRAPTLLIVGDLDSQVLQWNRQAATVLRCEYDLQIVPGATHLFEEPGALDQVAELARNWFQTRLPGGS